jgi:hypothetical protein
MLLILKIYPIINIFVNILFQYFNKNLGAIAYNVLVVNDGLPARIRACGARLGLANCGAVRRGSERSDRPSRT